MHNIGFNVIQVVYKRLGCIEEGHASYSDCVSFQSISESNTPKKLKEAEGVVSELIIH